MKYSFAKMTMPLSDTSKLKIWVHLQNNKLSKIEITISVGTAFLNISK